MRKTLLAATAAILVFGHGGAALAQAKPITTPQQAVGRAVGEDYFLANYAQLKAYWEKLATESDRMKLVDIGRTAEGRAQLMAVVSSPANLAKLDHYKAIAGRLAKAEALSDADARALAREGKAVVWIDCGLHATETVTAQAMFHGIYEMLSGNDPETLRLLDDVIILFGHGNPDGQDMVADWYMREADPKKREFNSLPRLYHKYVGHDNNRDFYMSAMPETTNLNRIFYREWFPQIVFNQHQTGPLGMVVFAPPFRDPFNFNYDPLVMTTLSEVGMAMHSRLVAEGKGGSGMRSAAPYSTWFNGSLRTSTYFHNSLGLLTEIIGSPTPQPLPLVAKAQLARNDVPLPIKPQMWHLKQSSDYTLSLNRAVLDYASRNRERLLFNIYRMGANSIARGSQDSWTTTPKRVDALAEAGKNKPATIDDPVTAMFAGRGAIDSKLYDQMLRDPAQRDPRGYIVPADQADLPNAIVFLNALIKNGVQVERATGAFTVAGKRYPAGSYVVKTAQAYRPHILDMFEPQDHPHDVEYPGGPPVKPYDSTGYTLAYQMGVKFDRVLDGFDGPFQRLSDEIAPPAGRILGSGKVGWLIGHETNNSFIVTNRLLKAGVPVAWVKEEVRAAGRRLAPGAIWIPASPRARAIVEASTRELGIDAFAIGEKPRTASLPLKPVRIGLVDRYGGLMTTGWTRWVFEQFEFPHTVIHPQRLDAGNLNRDFDVIVFPDSAVPAPKGSLYRTGYSFPQPKPETIPADYRPLLGEVSDTVSVPQVEAFARAGGTVIAIGGSTRLATLMKLPVEPALHRSEGGIAQALPQTDFYIPSALLAAKVDNRQPLAYGMSPDVDLFFDNSPTFKLSGSGVSRVSWFAGKKLLRSGWALGEEKLDGTAAVVDADVGQGKLFLMGPEVVARSQSRGTFKLLFNGLLYGPAVAGK